MKKAVITLTCFLFFASMLLSSNVKAQEADLYSEGSVWNLTFIKLKANMGEEYLKGLSKTWKASMEELVNQKLILSYKVLMGSASNPQDFDLLLMIELENFAAMDPDPERDKKREEVEKKIRDGMGEEFMKTVANYTTMREITGSKTMREIFLN